MTYARRSFLRAATALLGLPPAYARDMREVPPSAMEALNDIAGLRLLRSDAYVALGRCCAAAIAADASLAKSLTAPAAMGHLLDGLAIAPEKAAAAEVKRLIRRDFESGDTVVLDGWVMSQTECRLGLLAFWLGS